MQPHVYSFIAPGHWRCLRCDQDVFIPVGELPDRTEGCNYPKVDGS